MFTTIVATETSTTQHVQDIITISASTTTTISSSSSIIDATSFFDSTPLPLSLSSSSSSNDNTIPSSTSSDLNPSVDNDVSHVGITTSSMLSSVDLITRSKAICTAVTIQSKQLDSTQNSTIGMMMITMMMIFIMMMGDSDDVMMTIVIVIL